MMGRTRSSSAVASLAVVVALGAVHLAPAAGAQATAPLTFRSGVEVVELDVSVMRGGAPIQGLAARDFLLTDNGVRQDIQSVMLDRLPLSVTLLLDTSESVSGERLTHLVAAGTELTRALHADDRASLTTFSEAVTPRVPMTGDLGLIRSALSVMTGAGATSLRDAVHFALETTAHDATRPLLLLFTDGRDTSSWLTDGAVLDSARRIGVVTHVVRVGSDPFLDEVVKATGGRMWSATSDRQLRELFSSALDEMRARYLLTYSPQGVRKPGWHDIKVKLADGRGDITARPGYFVSAP